MSHIWKLVPVSLQWPVLWMANPKFVVGVNGVILNDQGQMLLLKHRFHHAHPWGLPGGWINRGEGVVDGLIREVWEETGYRIQVDGFLGEEHHPLALGFFLLAHVIGGEERLDTNEILGAGFFSLDDQAILPQLRSDHRRAISLARTALAERERLSHPLG